MLSCVSLATRLHIQPSQIMRFIEITKRICLLEKCLERMLAAELQLISFYT